jgi:predicted dehydrogenase
MRPVKFGVVSTAAIGRNAVIPAMQASSLCEVVAISSRDVSRARSVADELGVRHACGSLEELLAVPGLEAVYIPTPNHQHVEMAIQAAEAGIHVLCEKPIGLTAAQAEPLLEVEKRTGVVMSEGFMVRHHPRWQAAREVVRSGRLGQITQIQSTFSVFVENDSDVRFGADIGGGALYDLGVYPLVFARFLFEENPAAAFCAVSKRHASGVDVTASAIMEFPSGGVLSFDCSLRQAWAHWVVVTGTEGWMECPLSVLPKPDQETVLRIYQRDDVRGDNVEIQRFAPVDQYVCEVENFARAVRGERAIEWTMADAVENMRALDALFASAQAGERVVVRRA